MSEREVRVKLSASVTAYIAAMDQARASTKRLESESTLNMSRLGSTMTSVGQQMATKVSLPLVGVGVAATKMSNDLSTVFGRMQGLAGISASEVDGLRESVLDLSGETARSPIELANALYAAASSGLSASQAMDAVTIAAQGAKVGMGTTEDIVGLVASATASYGEANITAAEAVDVLTATIREGRAEPAELAGTLGRVLPIASQLGVSFGEVGATVAYLSNVFGDTNRTVTATQGLFVKLVSPSQQGRDALEAMGTSVEDLNAAVAQDGLLGALELLRERGFAGNQQALRALFDDIEGYQAALALLNADQAKLTGTFEATENSTGSLREALATVDEEAYAVRGAFNQVVIALVRVGDIIAPVVADIAGGIGSAAEAFGDLDPALQKVVIGLLGIAAAAGPVLVVTGSLIRNYATLRAAMVAYNSTAVGTQLTAGTLAAGFGKLAGSIAVAGAAYGGFKGVTAGLRDDLSWLERDVSILEKPFQLAGRFGYSLGAGSEWGAWRDAATEADRAAQAMFATFASGVFTMDQFVDKVNESGVEMEVRNRLIIMFREQLNAAEESERNYAEATGQTATASEWAALATSGLVGAVSSLPTPTDEAAEATETFAEQLAQAREEYASLVEQILGGIGSMFSHEQQTLRLANAYDDYQAAIDETTTILNDSTATDAEKAEALRNLRLDELALAESAAATAEAYADQTGASRESKTWIDAYRESLLAAAEQYPELIEEIGGYITALDKIPAVISTEARITFSSPGGEVRIGVTPTGQKAPGRAMGGPTNAGAVYEVLEGGKSEILTENGRHYLMSAQNGMVTPLHAGLDVRELAAAFSGAMPSRDAPLVNVQHLVDNSGTSLQNVFRTAEMHMLIAG